MMDPLYDPHASCLSIFDNLNLSITKLQKVKHFLQVQQHD